jgi:hypothetical protein
MSVPVVDVPRSARIAEAQLKAEAADEQSLREQRVAKAGIRRRLEENANLEIAAAQQSGSRGRGRAESQADAGHGWTRDSHWEPPHDGAPARFSRGKKASCR